MKHSRLKLIENLLFNKQADRDSVFKELPARIQQYAIFQGVEKTEYLYSAELKQRIINIYIQIYVWIRCSLF